jgi:hypothetical protein
MAEEMEKAIGEMPRDEEGELVELGKSDTHLASRRSMLTNSKVKV